MTGDLVFNTEYDHVFTVKKNEFAILDLESKTEVDAHQLYRRIRKAIEHQENPYRIVEQFEAETESWRAQRAAFLSYK